MDDDVFISGIDLMTLQKKGGNERERRTGKGGKIVTAFTEEMSQRESGWPG